MKQETEQIYKLVKKYGGVLTDDRHFMDDVDKLLETAHNSDYAKYITELEATVNIQKRKLAEFVLEREMHRMR